MEQLISELKGPDNDSRALGVSTHKEWGIENMINNKFSKMLT